MVTTETYGKVLKRYLLPHLKILQYINAVIPKCQVFVNTAIMFQFRVKYMKKKKKLFWSPSSGTWQAHKPLSVHISSLDLHLV